MSELVALWNCSWNGKTGSDVVSPRVCRYKQLHHTETVLAKFRFYLCRLNFTPGGKSGPIQLVLYSVSIISVMSVWWCMNSVTTFLVPLRWSATGLLVITESSATSMYFWFRFLLSLLCHLLIMMLLATITGPFSKILFSFTVVNAPWQSRISSKGGCKCKAASYQSLLWILLP